MKPEEGSIERTVCQGGETWQLRDGSTHIAEPGETFVRVYTDSEWVIAEFGDTYQEKLVLPKRGGQLELGQQYVGGLRLIRGWQMTTDDKLRSLSAGYTWEKGVQVAHDVPVLGGQHVGFFGFYNWGLAEEQLGGMVMGTYLGWGRCVRATDGFRCEYAKLEALADPGDQNTAQVIRVAEKYGVPMVTKGELTALKTGMVKMTADMVYDKFTEEDE